MLRMPRVSLEALLCAFLELRKIDPYILSRVETEGTSILIGESRYHSVSNNHYITIGRYAAHLTRQASDLRAFTEDELLSLDPGMDYTAVAGLSSEVRERLSKTRPVSVVRSFLAFLPSSIVGTKLPRFILRQGAAKRMEGMTPTAVVALLKYAKRTHPKMPYPRNASL